MYLLQAVIIYLVREVKAWIQSRGIPEKNSFDVSLMQQKERGWLCRLFGVYRQPKLVGSSLSLQRQHPEGIDCMLCELLLEQQQERNSGVQTDTEGPLTAAALFTQTQNKHQQRGPTPSFSQLLTAINKAMQHLLRDKQEASRTLTGGPPAAAGGPPAAACELPVSVEAHLKDGNLGEALAAFAAALSEVK